MPSATTKTPAHPFQTDDAHLQPIHEKVLANQPLDIVDVTALYQSKDILAIGWLANYVRERTHGNTTCFSVETIVASAAAKAANCALCGTRSNAQADIMAQAEQFGPTVDEFVVLHNDLSTLFAAIKKLRSHWPKVRVSALTVEEIAESGHIEDTLNSLHQAGADSLIGSGAEVFLPALRHRLWRHAGDPRKRAEVRQAAIAVGLNVPLYLVEHPATPEEQAAELFTLRDHQGDTFAAISFDPDATTSLNHPVTTGMQEMKQIAIARLALDNVTHIRAYWEMLGSKLLQIALRFGASELDGTPLASDENIEARRAELSREITVAGREPKELKSARKAVILA